MKRTLIIAAALLSLSVSAALAAPPADNGKPASPGQSANAPAKKCKAERGTTEQSIAAFKEKYGTNKNKANAFGKCVSAQVKKAEEQQDAAEENAAKKCKAERGTTEQSIAAFKDKYGTNANKANAFGMCVSRMVNGSTS